MFCFVCIALHPSQQLLSYQDFSIIFDTLNVLKCSTTWVGYDLNGKPGFEVIKPFSSSDQLSMKFQLFINVEIVKISGKFRFNTQQLVIYPAHKC